MRAKRDWCDKCMLICNNMHMYVCIYIYKASKFVTSWKYNHDYTHTQTLSRGLSTRPTVSRHLPQSKHLSSISAHMYIYIYIHTFVYASDYLSNTIVERQLGVFNAFSAAAANSADTPTLCRSVNERLEIN